MSPGLAIAVGAVIGLVIGILVSVITDIPLAPEGGLLLGGLGVAIPPPSYGPQL